MLLLVLYQPGDSEKTKRASLLMMIMLFLLVITMTEEALAETQIIPKLLSITTISK